MSNEANLRECKVCKVKTLRIFDGKWDEINKRWVDAEGGTWNGRLCPACARNRVRHVMNALRKRNRG